MTAAVQKTAATINFITVPPERTKTGIFIAEQMDAGKKCGDFGPAPSS
jgi:hypothetical protein